MHPLLAPITVPMSILYRGAIARRNARFDRGIGVTRFQIPVISVGNITVGGTGKSPMVRWICEQLLNANRKPVIAMRGYGATGHGASDEAHEYGDAFGDRVPVVADPWRTAALGQFLERNPEINCIVLDDGFQHRQIARDLDLVLIDASRNTFADRVLPAGRLRETLRNLARADAVIVTHGERHTSQLESSIKQKHGRPPLAIGRHAWSALDIYESYGQPARRESPSWLDGKLLATCFGVGNPAAVEQQVRIHGGLIRSRIPARDHQQYDRKMMKQLSSACATGVAALVVTAKDWVKLKYLFEFLEWPATPIVVPRLRMTFGAGEEALRAAIARVIHP